MRTKKRRGQDGGGQEAEDIQSGFNRTISLKLNFTTCMTVLVIFAAKLVVVVCHCILTVWQPVALKGAQHFLKSSPVMKFWFPVCVRVCVCVCVCVCDFVLYLRMNTFFLPL